MFAHNVPKSVFSYIRVCPPCCLCFNDKSIVTNVKIYQPLFRINCQNRQNHFSIRIDNIEVDQVISIARYFNDGLS